MKPIAILVLGCVPLAALTVWSFVELASVDKRVAVPEADEQVVAAREAAEQFHASARAEEEPLRALEPTELLAGRPLEGLAEAGEASRLRSLAEPWLRWQEALETAEATVEADRPAAIGDLDGLKAALTRLEELKTGVEMSSLHGTQPLQKVVRLRIELVKARIRQIEREREAAAQIAQARAAFQATEYARCVKLCDEVLSGYAKVIDARAAENLRILRQRAQFWDDTGRMNSDLETADSLPQRRTVLAAFLAKYPDRHTHTDPEQKVLDRCKQDLGEMTAKIEAGEKDQAATEAVERLRAQLPDDFSTRLAKAAETVGQYDTETCRAALQGEVQRWIEEFLPEKQIEEEPRIQEVETTRHEIVRGYFTEVNSPRGYKRYPTYEQSLRPVSEVGTYLANRLLGGPAPSLPRRCMTRYNQAREALIEAPQQAEAWQALAALCGRLDKELADYRRKPGSSQQPLSFEREARFAAERLGKTDEENLKKLWLNSD